MVTRNGPPDGAPAAPRPIVAGPASGRQLHAFELPAATGHRVRLRDYLRRFNVVLFFHHGAGCPACRKYLGTLTAAAGRLRDEDEAAVLAIGPSLPAAGDVADRRGSRIPLLVDEIGAVPSREDLAAPALVVADRFGEIWAAWSGGVEHRLPSVEEVHGWLDLIELQCPECGVPEWPAVAGE